MTGIITGIIIGITDMKEDRLRTITEKEPVFMLCRNGAMVGNPKVSALWK